MEAAKNTNTEAYNNIRPQMNTPNIEYEHNTLAADLHKYTQILKNEPTNTHAMIQIAKTALQCGNNNVAFRNFTTAMTINRNLPEPYWGRAVILFELDKHEKALNDIKNALRLDSPPTELRIDIAALLNDYGYCDEAREAIRNLPDELKQLPDYNAENIFLQLTEQNPDIESLSKQIDNYRRALPNDPIVDLYTAAVENLKNNTTDAARHLDAALKNEPELIYRAEKITALRNLFDN